VLPLAYSIRPSASSPETPDPSVRQEDAADLAQVVVAHELIVGDAQLVPDGMEREGAVVRSSA
jgi:hypothetical protein